MASSQTNFIFFLLLIFNFLFFLPLFTSGSTRFCSPNAIYQLGDSIADTGNLIRLTTSPKASRYAHLPYGSSFFKRPTGRCSNGLLMIDFIASSLRFPLLNPYLAKNANFTHGVNFAVAGSTALDSSFLANNNIVSSSTNNSLSVQLNWLKSHLKSTCHTDKDCKEKLKRSIFFVGEIGGNDFNYAFFQGRTMDEVLKILVPHVVQSIKTTVIEVIKLGATQVVIPGNFPIGCLPIYLTSFETNDTEAYDEFKCLKVFNNFVMFQNKQLRKTLQQLRNEYPDVDILYADYYNAFKWVFDKAPSLGFERDSLQKACCGSGGKYNFDRENLCGVGDSTVCSSPDTYINWDGVHLTQKAYMRMANWLIKDLSTKLKCML